MSSTKHLFIHRRNTHDDWNVMIRRDGERYYAGAFDSLENAIAARDRYFATYFPNDVPPSRAVDRSVKLLVSQEALKSVIHYDPETGKFNCIAYHGKRLPGPLSGCLRPDGYLTFGLDGRTILAHQLAWFYVYGYWPKLIDHKDRDKTNNRISNLRDTCHSINLQNVGVGKNNTSGETGISWQSHVQKYRVSFYRFKKYHYLGLHSTLEEAIKVKNDFLASYRPPE